MDDVAIKVEHVSKSFKLPHEKQSSLKGLLISKIKGRNRSYERQVVLKNISFEIKKGEFFGIVGRNGSGKSTLLKMLAGIYSPSDGTIQVIGKLTPFIELGVGFNPELTGRENVFLNGALLGFNRTEMSAMYNDIVAFAELKKFMDQKLKNYSSGMQVRLAFSIAIRAQSDILLLDEVLAVGDEAFQRKCYDYFETLKRNKKTVILVTHDMASVERFCSRAMFTEDGEIKLIGDPRSVAAAYSRSNDEGYVVEETPTPAAEKNTPVKEVTDLKIRTLTASGLHSMKFTADDTMTVELSWQQPNIRHASVTIVSENGNTVFGTGTYQDNYHLNGTTLKFDVELNLREGKYFLQVGLGKEGVPQPVVFVDHGPSFAVLRNKDDVRWDGMTNLVHKWE